MSDTKLRELVGKWRQQAKSDRAPVGGFSSFSDGMSIARDNCADELERALNEALGLKENNA